MDRQSRGRGFESPVKPFNFRMLKEFVLISCMKSDVRKTSNSNIRCCVLADYALLAIMRAVFNFQKLKCFSINLIRDGNLY